MFCFFFLPPIFLWNIITDSNLHLQPNNKRGMIKITAVKPGWTRASLQLRLSQSQRARAWSTARPRPSGSPVIQSAVLSQVKPASISQLCPQKARKADKTRSLSRGHLVCCPHPAAPQQRRRIGFSVPTRKSSSTDRDVTGAWQVSCPDSPPVACTSGAAWLNWL